MVDAPRRKGPEERVEVRRTEVAPEGEKELDGVKEEFQPEAPANEWKAKVKATAQRGVAFEPGLSKGEVKSVLKAHFQGTGQTLLQALSSHLSLGFGGTALEDVAKAKLARALTPAGAVKPASSITPGPSITEALERLGNEAPEVVGQLPPLIRSQVLWGVHKESVASEQKPDAAVRYDYRQKDGPRWTAEWAKNKTDFLGSRGYAELEEAKVADEVEALGLPISHGQVLAAQKELLAAHPGRKNGPRSGSNVSVTAFHDRAGKLLGASFGWTAQYYDDEDTQWWTVHYDAPSKTFTGHYTDEMTKTDAWQRLGGR